MENCTEADSKDIFKKCNFGCYIKNDSEWCKCISGCTAVNNENKFTKCEAGCYIENNEESCKCISECTPVNNENMSQNMMMVVAILWK